MVNQGIEEKRKGKYIRVPKWLNSKGYVREFSKFLTGLSEDWKSCLNCGIFECCIAFGIKCDLVTRVVIDICVPISTVYGI